MAIEGLPEELMSSILSKLPVKYLLRCKCVRKSWYSLIKSPQFIHLHLKTRSSSSSSSTSSKDYDSFIVKRCIKHPQHILSFYSYETLDDLGNEINIPISNSGALGNVSLSGHCDGLVCITNYNEQVLICNPATREFRSLFVPQSFSAKYGPGYRVKKNGYRIKTVAFGSDPNTGEYKVVMIVVPYDNSHLFDPAKKFLLSSRKRSNNPEALVYEFLVYDFRTNSWRETAINPGAFHYSCRAVLLNGAFHWCPETWDDSILTFRISDEVAETIPLPDFVDVSQQKKLFVSSKSQLCLILYDLEGLFEVCVMTEYGVKESWTMLFKIGPLLDICYPLALWDEQQQLLLRTSEGQLVSYDLQHQNVRYFPVYGDLDMYPYSESLVSVNAIGRVNFLAE